MLLEAIPSSVLLINRNFRIVSVNRNFLDKSRRQAADTIGRRLDEVFPTIILDQVNIAQRLRQALEHNRPTQGERLTYRAPGIPLRIYYYRIVPFSWGGMVEQAMLLMEDVTEQVRLSEEVRRVERHLASVVESASDIVLSTDIDGRILTWNSAAEKLSGFAFQEVKDLNLADFCAANHRGEMRRGFSGLKKGQDSRVGEWDLTTRAGERIPVSWVISPMKDDGGKTVGVVAVGRDLTERRKLEAQLLQSQKLAALGVMAGGIAHEIRNPLAVCSSAAQFLLDDGLSSEMRRECALKIHAGIQRASMIIENLLRFARPSVKAALKRVNLAGVLKETLALVANQAKLQRIELAVDLPPEPVMINGIEGLLQQAFLNIYLNAANAMPDGGVLRTDLGYGHQEVFRVRIADTGRGISPDDLDKIFDPFYTTQPVGQGTGLGLSICYSIIKEHLGSIEVESGPGRGSTFIIRFPAL
jgi:PAS domain S-box-containing protein